jgi:hypothetical protein
MSQVNITLNTNTVDINTTNNQIVVTDPTNPTTVNVVQPVTTVVEVITAGPQGPQGLPGTGSIVDTGSFVTTSSFNAFTSSYNTGSFTGSFTGSLFGTSSFAISSSWAPMRPGGLNRQIQFNNNGTLAGSTAFTFNALYESLTQGANTQASGSNSHAEGGFTTASGYITHAEGQQTNAIGQGSHAEGIATITSGSFSHAEGSSTQAIGNASHAEGWVSISSGSYSHAEGIGNSAIGEGSHAEGNSTQALGRASHAEGLGTTALGNYQHVQGQYNISSAAESAFIIGNGTLNNNRRNLVFASGSEFQITGSLIITGSLQGLGTVIFPNIPNTSHPDILYRSQITGEIGYAAAPTTTAATVDQINTPTLDNVFVRPLELEKSKHATINIYNNLNFI